MNNSDIDPEDSLPDLSSDNVGSTENSAPEVPAHDRKQIGPYKILQKIAEGGMGAVYMAEQNEPIKRRVALKLIKAGRDTAQIIARFDAERQALAMMDHANIARIFDAGTTEDGSPYFVMELVNGIPLTEYCDNNKLSIRERLKLFVPVCKAVQHAHTKGIIHRDLKPSNVLVALYDGVPVPKVIDFGLAKATEHQLALTDKTMFTEFGQIVGTLQYMSPEQAEMNQLDIDTRTDVYSLGVMLYELLTGTTPIDDQTMRDQALLKVLEFIRESEPPRPSTRLSDSGDAIGGVSDQRRIEPSRLQKILKGELDWIVMKSLEKDRTRRYETPNVFAQDISNYLNGETVNARPPSTVYQLQKFTRKNIGFVASVAAVGLVLLAGIIGTSFGLIRANRQTAETEKARQQLARESASSKFQLANARWDANRPFEARNLLHQIAPEYRDNFEWSFCDRHFLGSDLTFYGHTSSANSVAFSPNGARIASGSWDRTIKVWDAKTGREITTLKGHTDKVLGVVYSPDGSRIASGSQDGTIKVWDAKTGREITTLKGHTKSVYSVAFSPDGVQIASGSWDNTVKVWDAKTGREVTTLKGHTFWVLCVAFSPDGTRIASGGGDRVIRVWDAKTGQEIRTLEGHANWARSFAFSPDGSRIASGDDSGWVKLWNVQSGEEITTLKGHTSSVNGVAFSPNGERIASGSSDNTIKVWDAKSGQEITTLKGHTKSVLSVAIDPTGARIVSGSRSRMIKLWDARTGQEISTLRGHTDMVRRVAFSPDGRRIASGSFDKTIKLWNTETGQQIATLEGHTDSIFGLAFSPDGARIASASLDKTVRIWDTQTGEEIITLAGHADGVGGVAFSADGTRLASGSNDRTIKIWDAKTGQEITTLKGHTDRVFYVAYSPDDSQIASASSDNTIKLWDAESGQQIATLKGHIEDTSSVAFSPDGSRLASGSSDNTIKLWDTQTGQEIITLEGHTNDVCSVAFSPDGSRIVSGSSDNTIKLWDARSGREITALRGHSERITSVSFGSSGKQLFSETDQEQIVWDINSSMPDKSADWIPPAKPKQISPDGKWLVSHEGNNVTLVDLEFKNVPYEKMYREVKARFNPFWHRERAEQSANADHWYAATFHYAWLLQDDPDQAEFYDGLHSSHKRLTQSFETQNRDLEPHLSPVIKAALKIRRGKKLPETITVENAQSINNATWSRVATSVAFSNAPLTQTELVFYRELVRQHPRANYYNTLATFEYRLGNHKQAIAAAGRSIEFAQQEANNRTPSPGDYAIIAMSHIKLGDKVKANDYREKFEQKMKLDEFENDPESRSFANEVEELFHPGSKTGRPKPDSVENR